MAGSANGPASKSASPVVTGVVILALFAAGAFLGTRSTLTLTRASGGGVTAVNAWRFAGITLLRRSVDELREARMAAVSLTQREQRSSANRTAFGQLVTPEELLLVGRTTLSYPYRDDQSLISGFLKNPSNATIELTHPVDIRRTVASWLLLTLAVASAAGWVVTLVLGYDPLAGAPDRVTPLPAPVGAIVLLGVFAVVAWFFTSGHHVFGPVATRKVERLMTAAGGNDRAGIEAAVRAGVYVDVRDGQDMTALMIAARADAVDAVDALLRAGANPGARNMDDDTALMAALGMRKQKAVHRLLDAPLDVQAADSNGRTALYVAGQVASAEAVTRLIRAGANVNQADIHGWTPLMAAAAGGSVEAVQALLAAGANAATKQPDGRTALDVAASSDIANALRQ